MRWVAWLVVAGCSFRHGIAVPDGDDTDAPVDTPPDGQLCFGTGFVQVCETAAPPAQLDISQPLDTGAACDSNVIVNVPNVCVKIAHQIDIASDWTVHGTLPLVLVAEDTIAIEMRLDASSHDAGPVTGPGANSTMCGTNNTPGQTQGGPGGSFGGTGGPGSGTITASGPLPKPTSLRGGCRGSDGGAYTGAGGAGGDSGGAIYLIAGTSITVMSGGSIDASGAGGRGGKTGGGGGGGGGSGGMIVLDSPVVMNAGNIFASSGGGGEGGDNVDGKNGGKPSDATHAAAGGSGATSKGGGGGIGSFDTTKAGGAGAAGAVGSGDGGGGGGAGYILLFGATAISGGSVGPPPS